MGAGFYENTNGVPLENGRVHHLGLAPGEVANRVVSVGSLSRATLLRGLVELLPLRGRPRELGEVNAQRLRDLYLL